MDADGDFVVTWQSFQDGFLDGIYAQRYSSTGAVVGSEFQVNTYTSGIQKSPSVAMDTDGDFVISWISSGQDVSGDRVYAQRYSSDGTLVGSEFKVNTYTIGNKNPSSVKMDADGDFVITWISNGQDGSGFGVYAQRYSSDGTLVGSEFKVNTYTTGEQGQTSIAMDADGDFVITWQSYGQDGRVFGVYAQRYSSNGSAVGSEFQVHTYTAGDQGKPSVVMDSDGDFVITWSSGTYSYGQDGSGYGIYAQRYSSNGSAVGSEFRVNTNTTVGQKEPSVAMDSDGDFVVTWQSFGQDGSNYGIYKQNYRNDGSVMKLVP
jgi:hypothetical protein